MTFTMFTEHQTCFKKSESPFQIPQSQIFNVNHLIFPTHLLILSYPNLILEKTNENQHGETSMQWTHGSPWQSHLEGLETRHWSGSLAI